MFHCQSSDVFADRFCNIERTIVRAEYVLRETRTELEALASRLGQRVMQGNGSDVYGQWRSAQRALVDYPQ